MPELMFCNAPCEDCGRMIYDIPYIPTPLRVTETHTIYRVNGNYQCECGCPLEIVGILNQPDFILSVEENQEMRIL